MMLHWQDIAYLATGTARQKDAANTLMELALMERLAAYTPVVIGTIPLDIDVPGSDLDIACHAPFPDDFMATLTTCYGTLPGFRMKRKIIRDIPSVVAEFRHADLDVQVFAQPQPVTQQYGYRHMLVEAKLLAFAGPSARNAIRGLKLAGLPTEPAFARYFRLEGDPYDRLWSLSFAADHVLQRIAARP